MVLFDVIPLRCVLADGDRFFQPIHRQHHLQHSKSKLAFIICEIKASLPDPLGLKGFHDLNEEISLFELTMRSAQAGIALLSPL